MTIDFLNVWNKAPKMVSGLKNGDPLAYLRLADEARTASYTAEYLDDTLSAAKNFKSSVAQKGFSGAYNTAFDSARANLLQNWSSATDVSCFKYISNAKFHNAIPSSLRFLNGSMLETSLGKGIVSKLGGQVAFKSAVEQGAAKTTATITGGTAARVAGKSLARIPVIGVLISALFEIPDLMDAKRNGDFGAQLGRSAVNVACTTAGMAVGAAIGSAAGPVGTIIGGFIGGMVGGMIGKGLGKMLFGKSIKDKMIDGDYSRSLMKSYQNTNFYNAGTGKSMYNNQSVNVGNYSGYSALNSGSSQDIDVDRLINSINQGMARYN
ncbi:MAG: hypothetical protein AB7V50_01590 [Vampirovibrionia bacterium]